MTTKKISTNISVEEFLKTIDNIILNEMPHSWTNYNTTENGFHNFYIEIFVDYGDATAFVENSLCKVLANDKPMEKFNEILNDMALEQELFYLYDDFEETIKKHLSDEEKTLFDEVYNDEVIEYINSHVCWSYDPHDFLKEDVCVNIMIDSGNKNFDYALDNYDIVAEKGELPPESSLLWLAKQQKKLTVVKRELKKYFHGKDDYKLDDIADNFAKSICSELINTNGGICNTLTFCVNITVEEIIKLVEEQKKDNPDPESFILLNKTVPCGLFNSNVGGGSVLGIEPETDIKIPVSLIGDIQVEDCEYQTGYGYFVNMVYGLSRDFWEKGLKQIYI